MQITTTQSSEPSIALLGKTIVASTMGAGVESMGDVGAAVGNLPDAAFSYYEAIVDTPRIGHNLKVLAGLGGMVVLPAVAMAAAPVGAIAGGLQGWTRGFNHTSQGGRLTNIPKLAWADVEKFDKDLETRLSEFRSWARAPLPPGKKPLDVDPLKLVKAAGAGVVGGGTLGVLAGLATFIQAPMLTYQYLSQDVWNQKVPVLVSALLSAMTLTGLFAWTLGAAPVAAIWGAIACAKDGYRNDDVSLKEALRTACGMALAYSRDLEVC